MIKSATILNLTFACTLLLGFQSNSSASAGDTTITYTNRVPFRAADTCVRLFDNFDSYTPYQEINHLFDGLLTFPTPPPYVFYGSWSLAGTGGEFDGGAVIAQPFFQGNALRVQFREPVFGFGANVFDDFDGSTLINKISLTVTTTTGKTFSVSESFELYGDCGFLGATSREGIISAAFTINDSIANFEADLFEVILACPCKDTDKDGICDTGDNCPTTANATQKDDDCDNVGNSCDLCPNGDDSIDTDGDGKPDCADWDGILKVTPAYLCGNVLSKVILCSKGKQLCVSPIAVADRLAKGDFIGFCNATQCPKGSQAGSVGILTYEKLELEIYPNPSTGEFNLIFDEPTQNESIAFVLDLTGRVVSQEKLMPGEMSHWIQVDNLPKGHYVVKVMSGETVQAIEEVIITN